MQKFNNFIDSLGSENHHILGFKTEEEMEREILKLIQFREEFSRSAEETRIKYFI